MKKSHALLAAAIGFAGMGIPLYRSTSLQTLFPALGGETERMKRAKKRAARKARQDAAVDALTLMKPLRKRQ